ncbi:MAG: hypothetical protein K6T94_22375 [Paenibacillus sp.]|nr:hypothetical protein [Paenibacillus sp.]
MSLASRTVIPHIPNLTRTVSQSESMLDGAAHIRDTDEPVDITKYMKSRTEVIQTRTSFNDTSDLKISDLPFGTVTVDSAYGKMKVSLTSTDEEIERVTSVMKKSRIAYQYYSSIWSLCAVALCFFITAGISGLLGMAPSIVGATFSVVGGIGAILDWKGWIKKNDDKSFS